MLVAILLLISATFLFSEDCNGPLVNVPAQWVYLPYECIDSSCGTYFDTLTGAKVEYDVGFSAATGEWATQQKVILEFDILKVGVNANRCLVITWTYPIKGYEDITISWNFSTCSNQDAQIQRIATLFTPSRFRKDKATWCQGHISQHQMSKLEIGMNYQQVVGILGTMSNGDMTDQGFKLVYQPLPDVREFRKCSGSFYSVYFDSSELLISQKFEHNW